jgi:uncharacterized repeat protein (TIGR03803 family)
VPNAKEVVLHNFASPPYGAYPAWGVIRDSVGNLYGTTSGGGASGAGVVFKIDPCGHETVLYSFTGDADGGDPDGSLILDPEGNLYGTTTGGGASGAGVVFKLDTSGNETVLYSFTGRADGGYPLWVTLARDSAGNLYGTTSGGGTADEGVVFEVSAAGQETVLHTFTGGADGGTPFAGVIFGPGGNSLRNNRVRRANKRWRGIRDQTRVTVLRGKPTVCDRRGSLSQGNGLRFTILLDTCCGETSHPGRPRSVIS